MNILTLSPVEVSAIGRYRMALNKCVGSPKRMEMSRYDHYTLSAAIEKLGFSPICDEELNPIWHGIPYVHVPGIEVMECVSGA